MENHIFQHKLLHAVATFEIVSTALNYGEGADYFYNWHLGLIYTKSGSDKDRLQALIKRWERLAPDSEEEKACIAERDQILKLRGLDKEFASLSDWMHRLGYRYSDCFRGLLEHEFRQESERLTEFSRRHSRIMYGIEESNDEVNEAACDTASTMAGELGLSLRSQIHTLIVETVLAGKTPRRAVAKACQASLLEAIRCDEKVASAIAELPVTKEKFNQPRCIQRLLDDVKEDKEKDYTEALPTHCAFFLYSVWEMTLERKTNVTSMAKELQDDFWTLVEGTGLGHLFMSDLHLNLPIPGPVGKLCLSYCDPPPREIFLVRLVKVLEEEIAKS